MIQAIAPRMSRGCSWVMLAIATVGLALPAGPAFGQDEPPRPGDTKSADPAAKDKDKDKGQAQDDDDKPGKADEEPAVESFMDPNAKKALTIFNPLIFTGAPIKVDTPPNDITKVVNMAAGVENVDVAFLKNYVDYFTTELSSRPNINAVINPPANQSVKTARNVERAVNALIDPLIRGRANNKVDFLRAYNQVLFESRLVKLLDGNYVSRIQAMIVLGMAGSSATSALDLYVAQIKKDDQVVWVKLWAARGITRAADEGRVPLDATRAIAATEAIVALLDSDPKMPYPAQIRMLEALGSMRIATARTVRSSIDAASTVMRFLADRSAKPEVRARAAWALGMMKPPTQIPAYNLSLIGHEIGELAVEIGDLIIDEYDNAAGFDKDKDKIAKPLGFEQDKDGASRLTSFLLFQVVPSLRGKDGVNESGLLRVNHPNSAASKVFLNKLDEKVKDVTREAYDLLRAGGIAQKTKRNDLDAKLADLKQFLNDKPPTDRHLVPGGPEFLVVLPKVAGAPAPAAR